MGFAGNYDDGDILIIINAAELVTCRGGVKKGRDMDELGIIEQGAVFIRGGVIQEVGSTADLLDRIQEEGCRVIDAEGKCVLPGFIDAHTQPIFAGDRVEDFFLRLQGATEMEIQRQGGGLERTVLATRQADNDQLKALARPRLDALLSMGVTTVAGNSGFGLDLDTELRQLEVIRELNEAHPLEIVPVFFGVQALPPRYRGSHDEYIAYVTEEVLPLVAVGEMAEFCAVTCEPGSFSVEAARTLLLAAKKYGLRLKIHADGTGWQGGAELAAELGAVSADHLFCATEYGLRRLSETGVPAVLLPLTAFNRNRLYPRDLIERGLTVALSTDFGPECNSGSLPLLLALAVLQLGFTAAAAVTALTANAAAAVGRADRIGSLETGKQADILILEAPSYRYLTYRTGISVVETVIKKGQVVWRK
ncbi:MAG TPA: imidazolonepropionase [Patescibacteria group bacterium]|nr:imidazolonepropionase [Patescibacteria group bacterium]